MGIVFDTQTVNGPDGYPLSGATHGAALLFGQALANLCRGDGRAGEALERAIALAPRFSLAYVAWAHDLMWDDDLAPLAGGMLMLAGRMDVTARERAHLRLARTRLDRGRDGLGAGIAAHLADWPGDGLCRALAHAVAAPAA